MEFLARHFTFFGLDFQIWMLLIIGVLVTYVGYLWKTDRM